MSKLMFPSTHAEVAEYIKEHGWLTAILGNHPIDPCNFGDKDLAIAWITAHHDLERLQIILGLACPLDKGVV